MSEQKIQNQIRNALVGHANVYRANVGEGWTGDATRLPDGRVVIVNPRRFSTGLPRGFSDLFGWTTVEITPEHVGQRLAVFCALEVKAPRGRVSPQQRAFLDAVERAGGIAAVVRSADDAVQAVTTPREDTTA